MDSSQELTFVKHLFHQIRDGLKGRGVRDLVGDGPRERFHAGVLLPIEPALPTDQSKPASDQLDTFLASARSSDHENDAQATPVRIDSPSALAMDFLVRLPEDSQRLVLRIQPHLSLWYAIFPGWSDVQADQSVKPSELPADESSDSNADHENENADPADAETVPNVDLVATQEIKSIPRQIADAVLGNPPHALAEQQDDVLILPRKFRKWDVAVPVVNVVIDPAKLSQPLDYRDELDTALAAARESILATDPDVWKHIGSPNEGKRELRGRNLLSSEDTYNRALHSAAQGDIALPTWRAYVEVSGEPLLLPSSTTSTDHGQVLRVNVSLVNATPGLPKVERRRAQLEERAIFDCRFSVHVDEGDLIPFEFQGTARDYRYDRAFDALGSNCVAIAATDDNARYLYTETVPLYEQAWYRTRDDLQVAFADLDDAPNSRVIEVLASIAHRMDAYTEEWNRYLTDPASSLTREQIISCSRDRDNFISEVQSFKLGIETLQADTRLLRAFRLMNRVFRENGQQRAPAITHWRLFQLAFMVIQLPTLLVREWDLTRNDEFTQALQAAFDRVDVLWFPTGGGKTEAYLGLITTALFYDRLRGKDRGVSAWMRFPLRMLSLQQLERLARVVARAEMIRATEPDLHHPDDDPFSIGYYVGGNNTPNRIRDSDIPKGKAADDAWEREQILRVCPFCGSEVAVTFRRDNWRLVHQCRNETCYSNTSTALKDLRGSLPLFIVDNEIYRYRPSVLVGTVDKLAVLGFQKHFAHLLTNVTQQCPLHGYLSFGQCVEGGSSGACALKSKEYRLLGAEKDPVPAFLIQDELHLLKEELGTFNAHYEGFLSQLPQSQGNLPSKVLAATATIEAYDVQAFHLYLKSANRFPQPSWREGESFYATSSPLMYRRLYAGVLTHQRSPEDAVLRALALYNQEIQRMLSQPETALEELGLSDITTPQFLDFLHLYDLSVTYVNKKATGGNIVYRANQIVSRELAQPLDVKLLTGDDTMTEVGHVISRIERERHDVDDTRLDVLVATSLISHGVDLERINFLTMAGMPSKYAEYIQASSRAARNHVGLVMVCFKRGDVRERSQYHYFVPNHRYLDRLVEPVPINRFAAFATKRTAPGLIAGMLLSHYSRVLYADKRIAKPFDNLNQLREAIKNGDITPEQISTDLQAIIGLNHPQLDEFQRQHLEQAIKNALEANWDQIQRSLETRLTEAIHPMLSFRDVDEVLDFIADGAASAYVDRIRNG